MLNPPITGIEDLDAWLYNLHLNGVEGSGTATTTTPDPTVGDPVPYLYQYIHIKYADDNIGTGLSDSPTNKTYWGIYNSATSTESTNPADYTWYLTTGFGTTKFLYYLVLGGRQVKFYADVAPPAPTYKWVKDAGVAVDIDNLVPADTVKTPELAIDLLSDITANMGTITGGNLVIGAAPAISGTTMTGSGSLVLNDGRFASGDATTNIVYNGSVLTLNGNIATTKNSSGGVLISMAYPTGTYFFQGNSGVLVSLNSTGKQVTVLCGCSYLLDPKNNSCASLRVITRLLVDGSLAYWPVSGYQASTTTNMPITYISPGNRAAELEATFTYVFTPSAGTHTYAIEVLTYALDSTGNYVNYNTLSPFTGGVSARMSIVLWENKI